MAVVWMDEYAEYIYKRKPSYRHINPGDISEQTALRNKLQCKPFKWFMENVAFDLPKKYPPVEPPNFGDGFIKSLMDSNMCADATDTAFTKRYLYTQRRRSVQKSGGAGSNVVTSNMIYIVALGGGFKCPRKFHLNT